MLQQHTFWSTKHPMEIWYGIGGASYNLEQQR